MEDQTQPGDSVLRDLYESWIWQDFDYIKYLNSENKIFQEIREKHSDNWEVVELCRESLFENAKLIKLLMQEIEGAREKIKAID